MIRRLLLLQFFLLLAGPATAQTGDSDAAVQSLRRFVNRNSLTVDTTHGLPIQSRITLGASRGCVVEIDQESTTRGMRSSLVSRVDLARLSPEIRVGPGAGGDEGERTVHLVSSDGGDVFDISVVIAGRRVSTQAWRHNLSFSVAAAENAARLFGAAVAACGGTPPSPEEAERIAARALHADGNDPETFPLKGRCLGMVAPLVPAAAVLPADSTLAVARYTNRARIEVSGRIGEGTQARRFSCGFRQDGGEWLPDGANLSPQQPGR